MKNYGKIGACRLLDIRVIKNDVAIYEGMIEDAPVEVKDLEYSKVEMGKPIIFYATE